MSDHAKELAAFRQACEAARPIIAAELNSEIENNAHAETTKREGSVRGCGKFYYHEDTIDEPASLAAIETYRRALKYIDHALSTSDQTEPDRG